MPSSVFHFQYPSSSPVVEVRQPRGLTDDDVKCLETQLSSHLQANIGVPIIFEIFQVPTEIEVPLLNDWF
jgi:hypothetical protein